MAAPKTVFTYPLNGDTEFTIPFEYLARKFIQVTLLGTDRKVLVLNTDYNFPTPTKVRTLRAWGEADGYENIEIRRYTSATERLVNFADGSILRATDLNISQIQSLHIAEEARDLTADTIGVNNDGDLDARGRKIVNLADATEPGHAVTLRQEQEWAMSTLGNRNAAEAAAIAAANSQSLSTAAANTSSQKAVESATSAAASEASKVIAVNAINSIGSSVSDAQGYATAAATSKSQTDALKADVVQLKADTVTLKDAAVTAKDQSVAAKDAAIVAKNETLSNAMQLGMSMWGYRSSPYIGFGFDDGQELDRATFPAFAAALDAGLLPTVTEAVWQADPLQRGCFVKVSSTGKFRMRDLNGKSAGSIGAVVIRGDGLKSSGTNGLIQMDAMQLLTGEVGTSTNYGIVSPGAAGSVSGSFKRGATSMANGYGGGASAGSTNFAFDNSLQARTATENRMLNVAYAYQTRLFGQITALGAAEAANLATSYAALASRMTTIETNFSNSAGQRIVRANNLLVTANTTQNLGAHGFTEIHSMDLVLISQVTSEGYPAAIKLRMGAYQTHGTGAYGFYLTDLANGTIEFKIFGAGIYLVGGGGTSTPVAITSANWRANAFITGK